MLQLLELSSVSTLKSVLVWLFLGEAGPQSLADEAETPCSFAALLAEAFCPLEIQCLTFERGA